LSRRVKLAVAYDGTAYSGWQVQPNGTTIQAVMEGAFSRILQEPVRLRAAGRTDAGVHAREQVVDFADAGVRHIETIIHGGNALLPPDIRVLSASVVPDTFDARRHATEKVYRYFLYLSPVDSPFLSRYAWHIEAALDLDAIRQGLSHLLGEHDFTSFRGQGCNARSPVRIIFRAEVEKHIIPGLFSIDVAGAGFLRREGEAFRGSRRGNPSGARPFRRRGQRPPPRPLSMASVVLRSRPAGTTWREERA
jgi:tRNA pseudouridine38-40 synthase